MRCNAGKQAETIQHMFQKGIAQLCKRVSVSMAGSMARHDVQPQPPTQSCSNKQLSTNKRGRIKELIATSQIYACLYTRARHNSIYLYRAVSFVIYCTLLIFLLITTDPSNPFACRMMNETNEL
jgi:hypothetical protein